MTPDYSPRTGLFGLLDTANHLIARLAQRDITSFVLRLGLAIPFWRSGLKKWDGFLELSPITNLLFNEEFKLHIFGNQYPYPLPDLVAYMSGMAEIILPILLVLGIFTRKAALGLLVMTIIIQITVPTGWSLHITWAAMALAIMHMGGGRASIDHIALRLK